MIAIFGNERPGSLMAAVAAIIKYHGSKGATMEDIAGAVEKYLPQYKPTSASPAVSGLVAVGAARAESKFGVRRVFYVRDWNPAVDPDKLRQHEKETKQARAEAGLSTPRKKRSNTLPDVPRGQLLIAIPFGKDRTEMMSMDEARALYEQLKTMFGKESP